MHVALAAVIALTLTLPNAASAAGKHQINLRLQADSLADGANFIHTFKSYGRLIARASNKKILAYELETLTRIILPMKKAGLREELQEAPKGSIEPECVEWKEQCYEQTAVGMKVCSTVCTKVYDPVSKANVPISDPPNIYVGIHSNVIDFDDSALINTDDE